MMNKVCDKGQPRQGPAATGNKSDLLMAMHAKHSTVVGWKQLKLNTHCRHCTAFALCYGMWQGEQRFCKWIFQPSTGQSHQQVEHCDSGAVSAVLFMCCISRACPSCLRYIHLQHLMNWNYQKLPIQMMNAAKETFFCPTPLVWHMWCFNLGPMASINWLNNSINRNT